MDKKQKLLDLIDKAGKGSIEAAEEIARQLRLRDVGGLIVIDFIDMKAEADRQKVADRLAEMLGRDRRKTVMHGWTKLGIMEMTRKRTGG